MKIGKREIGTAGAELTCYLQDRTDAIYGSQARGAVLIFPGGGYEFVSDAENEPVAMAYAAKGFQAFVLKYSVGEKSRFPAPQREAFASIAYIREHAAEFGVDPHKIAVVGFSAGGHLAASTGVFWNREAVNALADKESAKPDAMVLVYPCITAGEYAYPGIREVHGKDTEFPGLLSLEKHVSKGTPPTFLCHTAEDSCVPVMNSLLFAAELAKHKVPFEMHVFKEGPHGMSLATKAVASPFLKTFDQNIQSAMREICARFSEWLDRSAEFLRLVFEPVRIELLADSGT